MHTLLIKDLSVTTELDAGAMAAVSGGYAKGGAPWHQAPEFSFTSSHTGFDASQLMSQVQNTTVNNGNNVAFSSCIDASVNPTQNGKNTINFG